jgi:hypothetical protein
MGHTVIGWYLGSAPDKEDERGECEGGNHGLELCVHSAAVSQSTAHGAVDMVSPQEVGGKGRVGNNRGCETKVRN